MRNIELLLLLGVVCGVALGVALGVPPSAFALFLASLARRLRSASLLPDSTRPGFFLLRV